MEWITLTATVVNIGALFWAIRAFYKQRDDVRKLEKLTSELQFEVHRLTKELDYSVERLKRTRDLVTGLVIAMNGLRQHSREHYEKLQFATVYHATPPELKSLISVIGDEQLKQAYAKLAMPMDNPIWPLLWNNEHYDPGTVDILLGELGNCATAMLQRIHELWDIATRTR